MIEEKDLKGVDLSTKSIDELYSMLENAVGYAENLIEYELESR